MEGIPQRIDSKFRFVLLSAQRAEQLMRGAQPRIETAVPKATRIGMEEIKRDVVSWDYGQPEAPEAEGAFDGSEGE